MKISVLGMPEVLGNIYDRSMVIAFGTVILVLFGDCGNLLFAEFSKYYIYVLFLTHKKQNWF